MRVLLVNNCHYRRGGADVVYLNTGELLSKMGHDVSYFSTNSPKNEPTRYSEYFIDDIDALELSFTRQLLSTPRKLYSFKAKRNIEKLICDTKPEIAHIHLYKGGLTASILPVLRRNQIPVIITLHDYSLLCPRNILIDGDGNICEKCLNNPFYCVLKRCNRKNIFYSTINYIEYEINNKIFKPQKYFNRIICVCKFNCQKHYMKPKLRNKLVHIYNFSPKINTIVLDHKKGEYFLYFGRLSDEKGVKTLLKAWKGLDSRYKLKIAGDGKLYQEFAKEVRDHKEGNIDLLGYKTGEELKGIVRNTSFVIIPSECYENNPMTIIEAYSMGKPVIGSNVGGIPEILIDKKTGFLFEMRNVADLVSKINHAFSITAEEYELLSKAAQEFANDQFSEESHYTQLIKVYTEVINDFKGHAER
jgi:glycosyltransferase involved in cell wall biosynthesis